MRLVNFVEISFLVGWNFWCLRFVLVFSYVFFVWVCFVYLVVFGTAYVNYDLIFSLVENSLFGDKSHIFQDPIFHFHDGRKSKQPVGGGSHSPVGVPDFVAGLQKSEKKIEPRKSTKKKKNRPPFRAEFFSTPLRREGLCRDTSCFMVFWQIFIGVVFFWGKNNLDDSQAKRFRSPNSRGLIVRQVLTYAQPLTITIWNETFRV